MGMAASQARYLALTARKSNCEYEGQQINQARLNLSNQTANLFNQMLGLNVPVPPSTQDYTKVQYSFTDGVNNMTIDSWNQLATPEEDYNYVINYHYKSNVYTGSQKKLNDPQVQFTGAIPTSSTDYAAQIRAIQNAQKEITEAQADYDTNLANYKTKLSEASKLQNYADSSLNSNVLNHTVDSDGNYNLTLQEKTDDGYPLFTAADGTRIYKNGNDYYTEDGSKYEGSIDGIKVIESADKPQYKPLSSTDIDDTTRTEIANAIQQLKDYGALDKDKFDNSEIYYDATSKTIAFKSDLDALISSNGNGTSTILPSYHIDNPTDKPENATWKSINEMKGEVDSLNNLANASKARLDLAEATFDAMSVPGYIGNCKLTPLSALSDDQMAEISQIIKDMKAQDVDTTITKCFNTTDGTYDASTYSGGLYSFTMNGVTYYTTYYDLAETANSGEGINHIDNQQKLPYYNATYVSTNIDKTDKALLETDGNGRFVSVRIGDDTIKYTLNAETITDDAAYQDAMNQYYYENAQYDKMVQDINAKTSLIQQEDQQLELRLKQLDTEQNALSTEIDAVSKVVKDNVEKSFKTFGG